MSATFTKDRKDRDAGFGVVLAMVALMWVVEVIDSLDHHRLEQYGIEPRQVDGLTGIIAAPFLHASFGHLISNTIPFVAMGMMIALGGAARVLTVTALIAIVGGVGTWLIGPSHSLHIGASGVVFGYATYLISRGIFNRNVLELAMGAVVGAVWGSALLGGLLPQDHISWQGHLFGAIGGVLAARALAADRGNTGSSSPAAAGI
jgi:membrane associated rhomboid family serine protease